MEKVLVAAAVVRRDDAVLVCRRPVVKRHGGLWEFPGGKLHAGESFRDALCRELREELGVELVSTGETLLVEHDPGSPFEIHFIEAAIEGEPRALEHEEVRWISIAACRDLAFAPSDRVFVESCLTARTTHMTFEE